MTDAECIAALQAERDLLRAMVRTFRHAGKRVLEGKTAPEIEGSPLLFLRIAMTNSNSVSEAPE